MYSNIPQIIVTGSWIVFILFWIVSWFSAKRTLSRVWGINLWIRLAIVAVLFTIIKLQGKHFNPIRFGTQNLAMSWLGAIVVLAGVSLAVWARVYLGSNWGMPMSIKENPELVTTGPYRYVRNPIYTGSILAFLGAMFSLGFVWFPILIIVGAYFIYSAKVEERIMLREFPDTYPAYRKRTKMLIPFII